MSEKKKCDFRDAEVGGFWSTKNPNVFNGKVNGVEVLLVRNLNKNNNTKFPEFRLYDKKTYSEVSINVELEKRKMEKNKQENIERITTVENPDILIDVEDIDFQGDF